MKKQSGFALLEGLVIIIVLAAIGFGGWWVWHNHHKKPAPTASSTPKYLSITELGLKVPLTTDTQDAYYYVGSERHDSKPIALLSTHSLDAYPKCRADANHSGVASVIAFTKNESDPINGKVLDAYPKAQNVSDLYYYIGADQQDCTNQKASDLHQKVRQAFIDAYSGIKPL